jgi:4-amino-4-deoxy-L-arabinose transferase-like glycosyltransferase
MTFSNTPANSLEASGIGPSSGSAKYRSRLTSLEIWVATVLLFLLLILKWFYVSNQPWDSDEPQHLHVVWAWANGFLPYKDLFDNHSPLFQAISAPIFAIFGERADIVMCMRWAMLPIDLLILFLLYRLGKSLFSARIGLWGTLIAASFPDFYFKLGEYRPDLFWAAAWLLILNLLVGGPLRPRRWFVIGIIIGLAFAVSMKTTFLLLTLLAGGTVAWLFGHFIPSTKIEGVRPSSQTLLGIVGLVAGATIIPALVIAFFAGHGALNQLYYCVIIHNLGPSGDQSNLLLARMRDIRFWLFLFTLGGGFWWVRQIGDRASGQRRLFFFAVVGFYCTILFSFWPLISKQDYIPFFPIASLAIAVPLVIVVEHFYRFLPPFVVPSLVVFGELIWLVSAHPPLKDTNRKNVQLIADTLQLTHPGETVLDAKGQTIFRARPCFFVLEQITRERVEQGKLLDDTPQRLIAARTPVVVDSHWLTSATAAFINQNYISVGSLMVLGKRLPPSENGKIEFEIVIPEKYAIINENGLLAGTLDGNECDGFRELAPGHHQFVPNGVTNSLVVLWARAVQRGFSPFRPGQH